ncbi:hypothetical protein BDB01DRAFT_811150 [Pilobolus umbonatus]|nr:hypothetical protein BDB01DRAFT_811150 [Pilobolus umbonatus]
MNSLPSEIIEIINFYTTNKDVYTCIRVCKSWYIRFMPHLYREIDIHSYKQLQLFHHSISSISKCQSVKQYVKLFSIKYIARLYPGTYTLFADIMSLCSSIESLKFPDTATGIQFLLSDNMPEMRFLNHLSFGKPSRISSHLIMDCYFKYKSTLTHLAIQDSLQHISCYYPVKLIYYINLFPRLTHLDIRLKSTSSKVDLLNEIICHCPNLYHLSYSIHNNREISNDIKLKHKLLTELELDVHSIYPKDICFIKSTFPNLKQLVLHAKDATANSCETVKHLMGLQHLYKLEVTAEFDKVMQYNQALFTFWKLSEHYMFKNAKKSMSFVNGPIDYHVMRFSFTRNVAKGFDSISFLSESSIDECVLLEEYLMNIGFNVNILAFNYVWDNKNTPIDVVSKFCPVLTELAIPINDLEKFRSSKPNHSIQKLTATECILNDDTLRTIELCFPNMKALIIDVCSVRVYPHSLPTKINLMLPETGLQSLTIKRSFREDYKTTNFLVHRISKGVLENRWYYSPDLVKTVTLKNVELANHQYEPSGDLVVCLTSSTLETCSLYCA